MLSRSGEVEKMVEDARTYLLDREAKLANMRRTAVEAPVPKRPFSYSFNRGDINIIL